MTMTLVRTATDVQRLRLKYRELGNDERTLGNITNILASTMALIDLVAAVEAPNDVQRLWINEPGREQELHIIGPAQTTKVERISLNSPLDITVLLAQIAEVNPYVAGGLTVTMGLIMWIPRLVDRWNRMFRYNAESQTAIANERLKLKMVLLLTDYVENNGEDLITLAGPKAVKKVIDKSVDGLWQLEMAELVDTEGRSLPSGEG